VGLGLLPTVNLFGFDLINRCWVTDEQASGNVVEIPLLDGELVIDPASLAAAANDFGNIIHHTPKAILRPGSVNDIIKIMRYARDNKLRIASLGNGHTAFGQSQVNAGVVIDMSTLNKIHSITFDRVVVDAGVVWRDLLQATVTKNLTPPVLTDYTKLTIGGTLSVGGIGGRSYRQGAQVVNVLELQVVTAKGQLVTCSESNNKDLFEAVLAGLGLCGVIVRATLKLIPAKEHARTHLLFYPNAPTLLNDLRVLVRDQRFDYIRGTSVAAPGVPGGFVFFIEAASFYTSPGELPRNPLQGLSFISGKEQVTDRTYFEYTDLVVQSIEGAGPSNAPHPWLDLLIADSQINAFASQTIAKLDPALFLSGSIMLFYPFVKSLLKRPLFRTPDEKTFFLFDILRTVPTDAATMKAVLAENRSLFEQNRALGGSFYTISAIPMETQDWKKHFQPFWRQLTSAKHKYDPANVLGAGTSVFP
jgi:cytokinin dehydrogenase